MITCYECDGDGMAEYTVPVIDYDNGGYLKGVMETCQVCGGTGVIEPLDDEDDED